MAEQRKLIRGVDIPDFPFQTFVIGDNRAIGHTLTCGCQTCVWLRKRSKEQIRKITNRFCETKLNLYYPQKSKGR